MTDYKKGDLVKIKIIEMYGCYSQIKEESFGIFLGYNGQSDNKIVFSYKHQKIYSYSKHCITKPTK